MHSFPLKTSLQIVEIVSERGNRRKRATDVIYYNVEVACEESTDPDEVSNDSYKTMIQTVAEFQNSNTRGVCPICNAWPFGTPLFPESLTRILFGIPLKSFLLDFFFLVQSILIYPVVCVFVPAGTVHVILTLLWLQVERCRRMLQQAAEDLITSQQDGTLSDDLDFTIEGIYV